MKCCKSYKNCGTELIDFKNSVLSPSDEMTTMASVQENLWKRYIFHVTLERSIKSPDPIKRKQKIANSVLFRFDIHSVYLCLGEL